MADWNFILTDAAFKPVGEILNAQERKVSNPLSKLDTASLKVRSDNPQADRLLSCSGYLKAYRDGVLRFMGPMISAEEVSDAEGASVAVNAASIGIALTKRLAGQSATGTIFAGLLDRAIIVRDLINGANVVETGIDTTATVSSGSAITYVAGPYRPIMDILVELATAFDGFDWRIVPQENVTNSVVTGPKVGSFVAAPVLGSDRTASAIFEYGTGRRNIESYRRAVSRETQANRLIHITSNGPGAYGFPVVTAVDTASMNQWGLMEDLVQADLLDATMRQQLTDEHLRIRKQPKKTIEFTPVAQLSGNPSRVPVLGVDYDVGDIVAARAAVEGDLKFDVAVRLYGVSFDLDELGNEKLTLSLVEEAN